MPQPWWVGTWVLLPFVLSGGLLLIRKTQREDMVINFLILYLIVISLAVVIRGGTLFSLVSTIRLNFFDSGLFFFLFVMFTEPLRPRRQNKKGIILHIL